MYHMYHDTRLLCSFLYPPTRWGRRPARAVPDHDPDPTSRSRRRACREPDPGTTVCPDAPRCRDRPEFKNRTEQMPCRTRLSLVSHPQSILGTCRTSPSASLYVRKVCAAHSLYPNSTHDVDTNLRRAHTSGAIGRPDSILNLMPLSSRSARGALRHQSCSWPEMLRIMKSSAAMPRGRRLPPGGSA